MSIMKYLIPAFVLSLGLGLPALGAEPPLEWDGLQKTKIKGIELAYVRPGVNLAQYSKVILDPVQVAFAKDWKPEQTGSHLRVSQEDRDRIKNDLAKLAADTIKDTLSKKDGYPVVETAGPEVMRLSTALVDVYINAPDVQSPGRSRTYVMNAGRMTLVAELRDSETGALFARVLDAREARNNMGMTWSSRAENSAEARALVSQWAKILRTRLDAVRAQSGE
ncbi:MAG TPA: DUF3313 family protein [Steroidobacteraceae bacterium]|nr:DUF3313 family protein [Steroidobacteraceae bacterium]